jgi:hypothetical protein
MTAYAEAYDAEESEFSEGFEMTDEAQLGFRPARRISVPGAGLMSATLNTPKGPARLTLPAALTTVTQFRQLEAALNSQTQRVNSIQAELVRVRRELAARRRDQTGQGSWSLLFPLLLQKELRDDLEGHTHSANNTPPTFPAGSGGGFSSLLPLLLLSPGGLTGAPATGSSSTGQDGISPLLLLLLLADL